jgi:hypothetical protein
MKKTLPVLFALLLVTAFFVYVSQAQMPQKGSKNTITLPNGDVIWDLNGEWDSRVENYGVWKSFGSYSSAVKITQTGSSFEAVRISGGYFMGAGETLQGEIDKNGFNWVQMNTMAGPLDANVHMSEDGNKMVIDDGVKARVTYTRK